MRTVALALTAAVCASLAVPADAGCGSDEAKRLYSTAYEHKKVKNFEMAIAALEKLFAECAEHHDGYILLVDSYIQMGALDSAIAAADRGLGVFPGDGKLLYFRAEVKEAKGDFDGAVADYKAAAPNIDDKLGICYNIARMYLRTNIDSAMVYLECAVGYDSTQTGLWDALLQIYELRYRNSEEVRAKMSVAYGWLYGHYPEVEKYIIGRGKGLVAQKAYAEAIVVLGDAVSKYPRNVDAWRFLSYAELGMGDAEGAVQAALKALELAPTDGKIMLDVADAYRDGGNFRQAEEYLARAEGVIPGETRARVIRTEIAERRALSMRCSNGWLTLDGDAALANVIAHWRSLANAPGWGGYAQARAEALERARLTAEQRNHLKFFGGCP